MTDLINKKISDLSSEELEILRNLVEKYKDLVQYVHHNYAHEFTYVLHLGIEHINEKHNNLSVDWKAWSILLLKIMVEQKLITNKSQEIHKISDIIDEFVKFYESEYSNYKKNIVSVSDFERDRGFVYMFVNKKR